MKPAHRFHIDQFTLSAFLAEAMLWLIEALDLIGAGVLLRRALVDVATGIRETLFVRAVHAAQLRMPASAFAQAPLFHRHTHIHQRAIIRAMLGAHLRDLTRGDDRTRIARLLHAIDHADAIVAALVRRIRRRAGRFNRRRLIHTPPRALSFANVRVVAPAHGADTS